MKKASSLTNIETQVSPTERSQLKCSTEKLLDAAADTLVNSCNQYLDQNRTIDIKIERVSSLPEGDKERKNSIVRFIPVVLEDGYYSKNNTSKSNEIDDTKQGNTSNFEKSIQPPFDRGSFTYGTLPHVLKKQQKHVRSLIVPKMRKMFEKSKSAEPEGQITGPSRTVKLKIQIDPPKSPRNKEYGTSHKDGTESVSSFVAVNKNLLEVVDNKRKKLAGERQRSASFSSNGGDEWSFSEGYDQTPEDSGTTDNSITSSKNETSSNHQIAPGLANDDSSNKQRISSKSGNQTYKSPISSNSENLSNQPVDSNSSSSSSNENNANVLNNKSFVNKCVSKVKNLVNSKQSSPQPGQ
jgi:hypothetical protein